MKISYRVHALTRIFQRQIGTNEVQSALINGETIEDYPDDKPNPSCLVLGWSGQRPIHVVAAYNSSEEEWIVITVFVPDPAIWSADFRRRLL